MKEPINEKDTIEKLILADYKEEQKKNGLISGALSLIGLPFKNVTNIYIGPGVYINCPAPFKMSEEEKQEDIRKKHPFCELLSLSEDRAYAELFFRYGPFCARTYHYDLSRAENKWKIDQRTLRGIS
jgi:hypothetical protein